LSLVIRPSTGPVLHGSRSAASTAARSRRRPRQIRPAARCARFPATTQAAPRPSRGPSSAMRSVRPCKGAGPGRRRGDERPRLVDGQADHRVGAEHGQEHRVHLGELRVREQHARRCSWRRLPPERHGQPRRWRRSLSFQAPHRRSRQDHLSGEALRADLPPERRGMAAAPSS
jgi:hypothetical protein